MYACVCGEIIMLIVITQFKEELVNKCVGTMLYTESNMEYLRDTSYY